MVLLSLLTALVLNREIRARGFFRSVFFYPVLLSPVVVALIWKWILQREGILNAWLVGLGQEPINWLLDANWAFFWIVVRQHLGAYGLLHADPAGRPAGDPQGRLRGGRDGRAPRPGAPSAASPCRCLMPNMLVVLVLALIKGVQTFDEIFVLTGGGPGSATMLVDPVHLRDRLRGPAAAPGPRRRRLDPARGGAAGADPGRSSGSTGGATMARAARRPRHRSPSSPAPAARPAALDRLARPTPTWRSASS